MTPAARRPRQGSLASLFVVGLLAWASPGLAQVFNYLPAAPNVSPGATGWQDVDVSAYVPVGATGVIVQWMNAAPSTGADQDYGIRKKGSTDPFTASSAKDAQQGWLMTGLDANRVFQVYAGVLGIRTHLVGYTMPGVTFLTNRVDKSTATTGSYVDVSIAADTGADTAIGAIFATHCTSGSGSNCVYEVRKKGSTDDRYTEPRSGLVNLAIIGVDAAETAQQRIFSASMDLYLVGYVTRGAVFFTNALDKSTNTTGNYDPVDMTADLGAGAANGVFLEISDTGNTDRLTAVRPGGSSYDYYADTRHTWAVAGLDAGDVFEQKIELNTHDIYVVGYSLADATPDFRVKSGTYVGNGTGQAITGVGFSPDMVVVDGDGGGADALVRTSTMTGTDSKQIDNPAAFLANQIVSLDADGFSLGTDFDVNQTGITYYWVAFRAAPGYMKVGTYAGSAAAQNIGGVGFSPAYVWVMSPLGARAVQKADLMPTTFSMSFDQNGYSDAILDIQANGFRVGTNTAVSGAGTTFHYVAWNRAPGKIAVGTYTGNKADNRDITGVGFWPEYVIVDRSANAAGVQGDAPAHKPASSGTGTDVSLIFDANIVEADNVQALQADGFQLGTHCRVNGDGTCPVPVPVAYYYAAFGPHVASGRYRSVGTNGGNLSTGGQTVTISGTTATFSGSMPANVGVGDVLQYQVPPAGPFYLAFIHQRTSDTVYSVRTASGGTPQAAVAGTAVGVYRAYTLLSNWQLQIENASINPAVVDFDTSRDLVAAGGPMHVACYNDGPMNDMVNVTGWFTALGNYVRIFTPTKPYEVGVSQRHTGVAGTGFRLTPVASGANYNIINLNIIYIRIEGLEIDGSGLTNSQAVRGVNVLSGLVNVGDIRIDSSIIHDLHTTVNGLATEGSMGILDVQISAGLGPPMTITNNVIYDVTNVVNVGHIAGIHIGSRATSYVQNNTIFRINNTGSACAPNCGPAWGIYAKAWPEASGVTVIAQNNYVGNVTAVNPVQACYGTIDGGVLTQSFNVSSDATAGGTGSQINKNAYATYFQSVVLGSENLHLTAVSSAPAMFNAAGTDLSASFFNDVDGQLRTVAWDIGADEFDGTTAVKLMAFDATAGDGEVGLAWRTGSELSNLGFHVYRGPSADGPWTQLTASLIPGLGTSAVGQSYAWRDSGLVNGVRYFYRLEDVDTASVSTLHGPISAVPAAAAPTEGGEGESGGGSGSGADASDGSVSCPPWLLAAADASPSDARVCTRHGNPEAVSLEVLSRRAGSATLELRTGGFYALHEPGGTVRVFVPGFDTPAEASAAALPVRRALVEAVAGRKLRLVSVRALELARFPGLRPSAVGLSDMQVSRDGTVRPRRRAVAAPRLSRGYLPQLVARLAGSVFQGETKSAVVELSPIQFDGRRRQLVLAQRVRIRLAFAGREAGESGSGSRGRALPRKRVASQEVLAQLHTSRRGLHGVSFEELFSSRRKGVATSLLSVERQGQAVPFHVEPPSDVFGPGSTLYFFADRVASSTDYSPEVAWELVRSTAGQLMASVAARPNGPALPSASLGFASAETNKIYQPGLLDAPDIWLWEALVGGAAARSVAFSVDGLDMASPQTAELTLHLQGGSDSGVPLEHHVRVALRGVPIGDVSFAGKQPHPLSLSVPLSLLGEGANTLELLNLGDSGVYSLVFLDRLEVRYPQVASLRQGVFEGTPADSGALEVGGVGGPAVVLDVTQGAQWLSGVEPGPGSVRFQAEAGRRYFVASREAVLSPRLLRPAASSLRNAANQADYVLIAPRAFMDAARPLVERRSGQGLSTIAASFEDIADGFGHGQPSAEAIRDFLTFSFHSWKRPSPRYVLLLGDASYDPRRFVASSFASPLPALWAKTNYLWTASDPALAAVNGSDSLPDIAIGRLPATTVAQAETLVAKLLAWEDSGQGFGGAALLVADNPDIAGDFEADVEDVRASFLASRATTTLKLSELGAAMRPAILAGFDAGPSLVSYVGHGGAAVWASENVLNSWDVPSLLAQSRQPLLLTMNCLNGYFVASSFDSLSEALVKAEGRGAIAAFSPSGLSLDGPAHVYHRAVLSEITGGRHDRLGDALLAAQASYATAGVGPELLSIYHLFGDPAMPIR